MSLEQQRFDYNEIQQLATELFGEVRTPNTHQVKTVTGLSKSTILRLVDNPRSGFPPPWRVDPTSARSGLRWLATSIAEWVLRQQRLTIDLKEEATPLEIHLSRGASA